MCNTEIFAQLRKLMILFFPECHKSLLKNDILQQIHDFLFDPCSKLPSHHLLNENGEDGFDYAFELKSLQEMIRMYKFKEVEELIDFLEDVQKQALEECNVAAYHPQAAYFDDRVERFSIPLHGMQFLSSDEAEKIKGGREKVHPAATTSVTTEVIRHIREEDRAVHMHIHCNYSIYYVNDPPHQVQMGEEH
jgi:hypothetical protein